MKPELNYFSTAGRPPGDRRGEQDQHKTIKRRGFSLVEIMLAVVIIGILAGIAIPTFQQVRRQANISKFVNDLRSMSGQFEGYHFANARWPEHSPAGQLPPGVEGYVSQGSFSQTNAVGSAWRWYNSGIVGLAVEYGATDREIVLYQDIAERIDNGDLFSGRFRLDGGPQYLVWVLSE